MMNADGWGLRFHPWLERLNGIADEAGVPVVVAVVGDDEERPTEFAVLLIAASEEGTTVEPMGEAGTGAETVANLWRIWAGITGMPEAAATN